MSVSELFAILTLKYGIAPDYVLDKMQTYEVKAILEFGYYKNQEDWEQTRLAAYVTAQCNSSKKMKPADIVKFPWEDENGKKRKSTPEVMSDTDLNRLKSKAQWMIDNDLI